MPADCAGKNDTLKVAAFFDQIVHGVAMRDADDILLNNGPLVQHLGHVVAGRADKLYPAVKRGMVRLGADKGGQEGMMNIDNLLPVTSRKLGKKICIYRANTMSST